MKSVAGAFSLLDWIVVDMGLRWDGRDGEELFEADTPGSRQAPRSRNRVPFLNGVRQPLALAETEIIIEIRRISDSRAGRSALSRAPHFQRLRLSGRCGHVRLPSTSKESIPAVVWRTTSESVGLCGRSSKRLSASTPSRTGMVRNREPWPLAAAEERFQGTALDERFFFLRERRPRLPSAAVDAEGRRPIHVPMSLYRRCILARQSAGAAVSIASVRDVERRTAGQSGVSRVLASRQVSHAEEIV